MGTDWALIAEARRILASMTSDEVKRKILRAHEELQAIGDEHVDLAKEMGQDIALSDINAMRDGSQAAWDEDPLLHNWRDTYSWTCRLTTSPDRSSAWVS